MVVSFLHDLDETAGERLCFRVAGLVSEQFEGLVVVVDALQAVQLVFVGPCSGVDVSFAACEQDEDELELACVVCAGSSA